ncbi:MAG: lipid-A-disaccharide synthase N-terminal domain-containing protein [Rhodanobacteraceae bacterium]
MHLDMPMMQQLLHKLAEFELTPWKTVGLVGSLMFASRWFVQVYYTRKLQRVVMPMAFWLLSVAGSTMMLAYFVLGKNDSVGIVSTLFPAFVSVYNLSVHLRHRKNTLTGDAEDGD